MSATEPQFCPTFRPTKAEFSKPFSDYVQDVCKQNPGIPMFKVVPPKGWRPRKTKFPELTSLRIQTPIKQHVFGTGGAFRCFFEEQRSLTVADFKKLSSSGSHKTPPKGHRQDDLLERAFWSSVTINPPFYGADTPTSFFDERLEYGWNLRSLENLLKMYDVPPIPGVTTPMTYFGMWKSFFSWHLEDIDLYSINYLHFGAPKVWYCVSPKDRVKFEEMAKGLFPELHNICPAFLRHKDILLSPKTLRNHHINYVQAKQEGGEFIVLNAGAYHSGFNLGFNCAEAVNFATADWLPAGRAASHCTCTALPDHVTLDMKMFSRGPRVSQRLKAALKRKGLGGDDSDSSEEASSSQESSGDEAEEPPTPPQRKRKLSEPRRQLQGKRKLLSSPSKAATPPKQPEKPAGRRQTAHENGPAGPRSPHAAQPAQKSPGSAPGDRRTGSSAVAKLRAARGLGSKRLAGQPADPLPALGKAGKRRKTAEASLASGAEEASTAQQSLEEGGSTKVLRAFEWVRTLVTGQQPNEGSFEATEAKPTEPRLDRPCAVVGEDDLTGEKYFQLVQRLDRKSKQKGQVAVRYLQEDEDGIFRPTSEVWEEAESALVPVRSQPWRGSGDEAAGVRLLTLRSRILDTELLD